MKKHISVLVLFIFLVNSRSFSQSADLNRELKSQVYLSDSLSGRFAPEKLYIQFDKPYYAMGDTVWFKAYLLNGFLTGSHKSNIINIDIANDSNKVIKQYRIPAQKGLGWGNISLGEKEGFNPGTYTIHVYTNWMRNFGQEYFFSKSFYITGGGENSWLINMHVKEPTGNDDTVKVKLLFNNINKIPAANKKLQLQVMSNTEHLYKQTTQTDNNGLLYVNFKALNNAASLSVVAESIPAGKKAIIPIGLNQPQNIDVQFLPEGGYLVAGLTAHIGFKAIGEDGRGVDISGVITGHNQRQVAEFKSLRYGIGGFDLAVHNGENYTAKVTLPGGLIKEYPLPIIKSTGTVIKVKNLLQSDSLEVSVFATNDIAGIGNSYFLIGKARGIICYAAIFNFNDGGFIKRKIAKSLFPSGITHFTVATADKRALDDRVIYIQHDDDVKIQFKTGRSNYGPRDSVKLKIKVTDNTGKPIAGNFSLAVTDDAQVKTDTLNNENIISRMLLTSDLKGYIEAPGYYLSSKTAESWQALDNLLLTQGWVGYDWDKTFYPPAITYQPETEFTVKGRVVNVFNRPVKGTDVLLFSKTPAMLIDTITNKDGEFVFDHLPRVDTPLFVIKAVNKNGKSFNVGITVDEIKPPDFTKPNAPLTGPWYVNSDPTLLNYTKNKALSMQQEYLPEGGQLLNEVKITAKKIIKNSQNLNGPGNADLVLDEKDLEKAGKKNWLQLLQENIQGFREANQLFKIITTVYSGNLPRDVITRNYERLYLIHDKKVKLVIDGILLSEIYNPLDFITVKNYLESHNAEDIKGIEVNSSNIYAINYAARYGFILNPKSVWGVSSDSLAFIEITTRSGHGPIIDNTPGMYLYKPLAISQAKQFYKPKYTVKDTANHVEDLRSTIDWEPNITTGTNGEATVSFFTADKPSTYTLIMEGTDLNGNLGYKQWKIDVGQSRQKSK